ncbi:MAG: zinc metalloprotease HtpX [Candidatus Njordarchaeales archaeon]
MKNYIKTAILLGSLTALFLFIGYYFAGTSGLTIALIFSLLMNLGTYWYSDKIVLSMYRAKQISKSEMPQLHNIIETIAKEANLPKPKVYLIPTENPNAFATGRNPKHAAIAVTQGILNLLSEEELKGVLAHELAHIKNRDILISTIAATIAGVISYLAFMARFAAIFGGMGRDQDNNILELLALAIIAPITATIIQLAISRSREYLADETGAKLIKNPEPLASALLKLEQASKLHPIRFGSQATSHLFIVNPFSARSLINLFSTHPLISERVNRLRNLTL